MRFYRETRRGWWKGIVAFAFALTLQSFAQAAPRTFVASTGNDANTASNCPVTAPCQSFAAAYSVTNVGGEIIALDTAGYGSVTITNSVAIIAIQRAFVKVNASSTGITITGGSVFLTNIEVTGLGNANTTGISVSGGAHLILKNSALVRLATGLSVSSSKADVIDSDIVSDDLGVSTTGTGVDIGANGGSVPFAGGPTEVRFNGGNVVGNTQAFKMNSPGASVANGTNNVTILLWASSGAGALTTYVAGNSTLINGTGVECAGPECKSFAIFFESTALNLQ